VEFGPGADSDEARIQFDPWRDRLIGLRDGLLDFSDGMVMWNHQTGRGKYAKIMVRGLTCWLVNPGTKKAVGKRPFCPAFHCKRSHVFIIFRPVLRFLTRPVPLADFAARFLAAVVLPPLLFLAIVSRSFSLFYVFRLRGTCRSLPGGIRHGITNPRERVIWGYRVPGRERGVVDTGASGFGGAVPGASEGRDEQSNQQHRSHELSPVPAPTPAAASLIPLSPSWVSFLSAASSSARVCSRSVAAWEWPNRPA
jgi:hypothetical protein